MYMHRDIQGFMRFYGQHFSESTVLPQMHILESHIPDWIKKWDTGLGLMGEQGAESVHEELNEIEPSYRTMPNGVDHLRCDIEEHHV